MTTRPASEALLRRLIRAAKAEGIDVNTVGVRSDGAAWVSAVDNPALDLAGPAQDARKWEDVA